MLSQQDHIEVETAARALLRAYDLHPDSVTIGTDGRVQVCFAAGNPQGYYAANSLRGLQHSGYLHVDTLAHHRKPDCAVSATLRINLPRLRALRRAPGVRLPVMR